MLSCADRSRDVSPAPPLLSRRRGWLVGRSAAAVLSPPPCLAVIYIGRFLIEIQPHTADLPQPATPIPHTHTHAHTHTHTHPRPFLSGEAAPQSLFSRSSLTTHMLKLALIIQIILTSSISIKYNDRCILKLHNYIKYVLTLTLLSMQWKSQQCDTDTMLRRSDNCAILCFMSCSLITNFVRSSCIFLIELLHMMRFRFQRTQRKRGSCEPAFKPLDHL